MRNKRKNILIIALVTTLIFSGLGSTFFTTAQEPPYPKLRIQLVYPAENLEGYMTFWVYVVDESYEGIEGATVYVETEDGSDSFPTRETDWQGVAFWDNVYKVVDETTIYQVWATHDDYVFDWDYVGYYTVTNKGLHFSRLPPDNKMEEQTNEEVCVEDHNGEPISCTVWFQNKAYPTGADGCVEIYAKDVTAENVFENPYVPQDIEAQKLGYDPATDVIYVEDTDNVNTTLHCEVVEKYTWPEEPIDHAFVKVLFTKYPFFNFTDETGWCEIIFLPETKSTKYYYLLAAKWGYWPDVEGDYIPAGLPTTFNFKLKKWSWSGPIVELEITSADYDEERGIHTIEFKATPSETDEPYTYHWNFGDGTFDEEGEGTTIHDYTAGEYIVSVTATRLSDSIEEYGEITLGLN